MVPLFLQENGTNTVSLMSEEGGLEFIMTLSYLAMVVWHAIIMHDILWAGIIGEGGKFHNPGPAA
jgi:hypothetical protein